MCIGCFEEGEKEPRKKYYGDLMELDTEGRAAETFGGAGNNFKSFGEVGDDFHVICCF